ncbi:MAG: hypothetical protein KAG37_02240, partial [Flavobacteriales bacterium]|nr:hypothetical protein [Flavobacteriales bacterium]
GRNLNDSISKNRVAFYNGKANGGNVVVFDGKYILKHFYKIDEYYLFDLESDTPTKNIYKQSKGLDKVRYLQELLDANFQSTKYLMFNNKKVK